MAGDWIPFYVSTPRKSEVLQIRRATQRSRHEIIGLLTEFWCWAQSVAHDRLLERLTLDDVVEAVGGDAKFWQAVAAVGWVEFTDAGVLLANAEWIEKGAKARLLKAKRQKRYRENVDASVDGAAPRKRTPDKSREESINKKGKAPAFVAPTLKEVRAYAAKYQADTEGWPKRPFDADAFRDHYESNGWKQSKGAAIKDWKATVRNWGRRDFGGNASASVVDTARRIQ